MNFSIGVLLVFLALIAFILAAIGWSWRKLDLIAIGLALWSLSFLIGRFSNISINTIVLLLAFLAFVASAARWRYRKVNLIGAGLALWVLSSILP